MHYYGGVLEMGLLIGMPCIDRDRSLDIVGAYLDESSVELCRHHQQQTDKTQNQGLTATL